MHLSHCICSESLLGLALWNQFYTSK